MKYQIEQLSKLQELIVRDYIFKYPKKPFGFSGPHCIDIDLTIYNENERDTALQTLVDNGYFTKDKDGVSIMPVHVHRYVKKYYSTQLKKTEHTQQTIEKKISNKGSDWHNKPLGKIIIGVIIGVIILIFGLIITH